MADDRRRAVDRVSRRHLLGVAASALLAAAGVMRTPWAREQGQPPVRGGRAPRFDEMYRGRRIQGEPTAPREGRTPQGWRITVDGRPLGLMRRADGSFLSTVDHYRSYDTPLAAARGAVDEIGPLQALSPRSH
ncbi:Tyrosinase co-factor OS=Streptomyces alboniger OX=132473 GN=CP975_18865 PE=4 SV=1 [Streptomyces alboniger]